MALLSFHDNMLRLVPVLGTVRAFFSFLDMAVSLNMHDRDLNIANLFALFSKRERLLMIEAYSSLVLEMSGDGSGLIDVLGEYFVRNVGCERNLSDQRVYDLLPGLFHTDRVGYRVADYNCMTGRRLLAAAKFNPNLRFFGADPDITMTKITLLNLCLNGLFGEVAWFDVRNDLFFSVCSVDLDYKGKPCIRRIEDENSLMFQKRGSVPDRPGLLFDF